MLYRPVRPVKIDLAGAAVRADSEEAKLRLERIAGHYRQLEELLSSVESRLPDLAVEEEPAEPLPADDPPRPVRPR